MSTTNKKQTRIGLEGWTERIVIHWIGLGGATGLLAYAGSWYAETLQTHFLLLVLASIFWIVTFGAISWTMWEFVIPAFLFEK
ncbi:MAG: hypothetical protein ABEH61_02690 [Haloarculaceae archaeon]